MRYLPNLTGVLAAAMVAAAPVLSPVLALAQPGDGGYGRHMFWDGGWHGWFLGPLMMVFWLLVLAGAALLVLRLLGVGGRDGGPGQGRDTALEILRGRFARGEIDKAEFEERRALLER